MAFGDTAILDNFNRANEGPPPSTSWTTGLAGGTNGIKVVSNQCAGDTVNFNNAYWNVQNFGPDTEVYCTVPTIGGDTHSLALYLRLVQEGSSAVDGYALEWIRRTADDEVKIFRVDNVTFTQLGVTVTDRNIVDGDGVGFEIIGSTLKAYHKVGAGAWTEIMSRTDSTYTAAGKIALEIEGTTYRIDDFGGGTATGDITASPVGVRSTTRSGTLTAQQRQITANPQKVVPSAADGLSVTPSGTAWANSSWVELSTGLGNAITVVGVVVVPGVGAVGYEIDIGKGAAGSEVVVARTGAHVEGTGLSEWVVPIMPPVDNIPASTRIAVRMRKAGTSTLTWSFKLIYFENVPDLGVGSIVNPQQFVPSAADGVVVTPSGTAWVSSSWVQLSASLVDVVLIGLVLDTIGSQTEWEIDIGKGAAASEVVVATMAGVVDTSAAGNSPLHLFHYPVKVAGTNRIAARIRLETTATGSWTIKLLHVVAGDLYPPFSMEWVTVAQKVVPNAAAFVSVTPSGTAWANSSWVELIASTSAAIVATHVAVDPAVDVQWEIDIGKGSAGSEVVVATVANRRSGTGTLGPYACPLLLAVDNIPTSTRVACRLRKSGTATSVWGIGLTYYEKPLE